MRTIALASLVAFAQPSVTAPTDGIRLRETQEVASILALAQVVLERCPAYKIDPASLQSISDALGFEHTKTSNVLARDVKSAMIAFNAEYTQMSSSADWCGVKYKLLGPAGQLFPGVMVRAEPKG